MEIKNLLKKKILILMILMMVLGIITIIVFFSKKLTQISQTREEIERIRNEINRMLKEEISKKENVLGEEFEKCLKGELNLDVNNDVKDVYYITATALIRKDKNICQEAKIQNLKKICEDYFDKFTILLNGNESDCEKLSDNNDRLRCKAILKKNEKICLEISSPLGREICKSVVTFNEDYCKNLSGVYDSEGVCNTVLGLNKEIPDTCGKVTKEEAQSLCLNSLYITKALREKNLELCEKIDLKTGRFTKLFCRVLLSPFPEKALKDFYVENSCYEKYATYIAKIKNDPTICEKIPLKETHNKTEYERCLLQFKK
jgi:hypothetical protein